MVRVTVPEEMELKGSLKLIQHRKMAESCACENTGVEKAACEGIESVTYENEGIENLTCESKDGNLEFIVTDPRLWTAEEPNLYELKLKRLENGEESDSVSLKIGLRKVEFVKEKGLLVNGRQVKLHGVCVHQDAGCLGVAARKEIWKGRLLDLKEMAVTPSVLPIMCMQRNLWICAMSWAFMFMRNALTNGPAVIMEASLMTNGKKMWRSW